MVDLMWQRMGTWRTKSGHMADAWWTHTRQTQEADTGRTRCERGKADTQPTRGRDKTVTWRTYGVQGLEQGGHMADARRTHGGQPKRIPKADATCTHSGHMADKVWRRGQRGIKADTNKADNGSRPAFFPQ